MAIIVPKYAQRTQFLRAIIDQIAHGSILMEADQICISVQKLRFAYRGKTVFDGVSTRMRSGRFTALLGPNGAGKSTLIALLAGLVVAQRGHIEILGADMARKPRAALAQMGFVFQQQTLDLDLSVYQNMTYFAALRGFSGHRAQQRIDACLEHMGLSERHAEKARQLNGGHRRRLEIARALVHKPRVLILDEPTVGLDIPARTELVSYVHNLCATDEITVLWATHLVDEVDLSDDLIVLHEGQVRAAGAVTEVIAASGVSNVLDAFTRLTANHEPAIPTSS